MHFQIPVLITIVLIIIIPSGTILIITNNYFGTTNFAYGQTDQTIFNNANQTNTNNVNPLNIQNIPVKKVHVEDIDVAYRVFGKGDPILLIPGGSDGMNAWDPTLMKTLSSNHTVIVFDPRGIGNTTIGSKPYTPSQLANDTTGLMDALKIPKAAVMGYSLGSYIAQQVTMMHPDKINSLILIGSSCGGKDHTPKPPEFIKLQSDI
ncbi:MAG: alpha/beta hydrolase, partial [Nitrososphaeraceae archaeon]|nr:alpha/beta hydrolase [Nitrososphaeraceae archaeon]